jgi:HEPN domain-containing protein
MRDPKGEGRRWLAQAENDLKFAQHALEGEFYHQVCFVAHQCSEKALKAILYAGGARNVIGHSVAGLLARLAADHRLPASLHDHAAELDLYYIPTRYPNGLVEGTPYEAFTRSQADRALQSAQEFLAAARREFGGL